MADDRPVLLSVHAHPDDESSKGAPTIARYNAEGVEAVLVCCTGGEQGDILNPAMDREDIRANLPSVRMEELKAATKIIGYRHVELLGYRDSGMAGTPANEDPRCFARADFDDAVGKLVEIIRRYRPDVLITYGDDQDWYPHPDHLRVHDISVEAFTRAADPGAHAGAGVPWQPKKLYYSTLSVRRMRALHDHLVRSGHESPFPDDWSMIPDNESAITTRIDVKHWIQIRADALRAHATQIDPESPMWFGMPPELEMDFIGSDDYVLAQSSVAVELPEYDLFAGLR